MSHLKPIALCVVATLITGCSSKEGLIPTPDQTMQEVYDQAMGATSQGRVLDQRSVLRRSLKEAESDYSDFVRTESTQLQAKFSLLPNPVMYMFVAPHLSTADGVPVPGYLTEFKLFTQDHYALPGEVSLNIGQ